MNNMDNAFDGIKLIDSHFHLLAMGEKGIDTLEFVNSFSNRFMYGIDIGLIPSDLEPRKKKYNYPETLKVSSGLYPGAVESPVLKQEMDILIKQVETSQIDAIGEAGLDWHWDYGTREQQMDLFIWQLLLARKYRLPIIIHNRLADREVLNVFKKYAEDTKILIHCFSSDAAFMKTMLDYDSYFSFCGNVTFKKSDNIKQALAETPADRILFETDSPYMSPVPMRGKINKPDYVGHVYNFASELLGTDFHDLLRITEENFKRLFNI